MYLEKLNDLLGSTPVIKVMEFGFDEDGEKLYRAATVVDNKPFVARHNDCAQAIENCAMLVVNYIDPNNWVDDIVFD